MPKRQPEAPEEIKPLGLSRKEWKRHCYELGCTPCITMGYHETPCSFHHMKVGMGYAQRNDDYLGFGCCPTHHQHGTKDEPSYHGQPAEFEAKFGTEVDLWLLTIQLVREKLQREKIC